MGATRAVVTVRLPSGTMVYVNEASVAKGFLTKVIDSSQVESGCEAISVPSQVAARASTVSTALDVHQQLNNLVGQPCHGLGDAYKKSRHLLPKKLSKEIRQLKRDRDIATHVWESDDPEYGEPAQCDEERVRVSVKNTFLEVDTNGSSTADEGGSLSAPAALETYGVESDPENSSVPGNQSKEKLSGIDGTAAESETPIACSFFELHDGEVADSGVQTDGVQAAARVPTQTIATQTCEASMTMRGIKGSVLSPAAQSGAVDWAVFAMLRDAPASDEVKVGSSSMGEKQGGAKPYVQSVAEASKKAAAVDLFHRSGNKFKKKACDQSELRALLEEAQGMLKKSGEWKAGLATVLT